MVLRLNGKLEIDNFRHYPAETVAELRQLLTAGALAQADPHRDNFFELESRATVFYIHVSPVSGKVLLLASWTKGRRPAANSAEQEVEREAAD